MLGTATDRTIEMATDQASALLASDEWFATKPALWPEATESVGSIGQRQLTLCSA